MEWTSNARGGGLLGLLRPYGFLVACLALLTLLASGLTLFVPLIVSEAIDAYVTGTFDLTATLLEFSGVSLLVFVLAYGQTVAQTYASERVARDLRTRAVASISRQDYAYVDRVTPAKLLTNLTSDIDAIKMFVSQAIASIISSVFLIAGAAALLLFMNWQLALVVLAVVPIIAVAFSYVFGRVRKLFLAAQQAIDQLNRVINESILGATLIRLVNSQDYEYGKFVVANTKAKEIGLSILALFSMLIPIVVFVSNLATLAILLLGGHLVIAGGMSLGDFAAFNAYLSILIFPIFVIGFMTNVISQATASYSRVREVLELEAPAPEAGIARELAGNIEARGVSLAFGEKLALKEVSFSIRPRTRTAIMGPVAAGKTQLLYLLTGLLKSTSGSILYDGYEIGALDKGSFYRQVGLVFQDSIVFNLTVRENIAFSEQVDEAALQKAIDTAELRELVEALPQGLDTVVSERGSTLSGGQKQRIMLARALAIDPKILLLDDFTARLDAATEKKILANVRRNYPDITLVSITQKIAAVEDYDQIILLMEGEALATGTHRELMETSPEYVQIHHSQQSTNAYELPA